MRKSQRHVLRLVGFILTLFFIITFFTTSNSIKRNNKSNALTEEEVKSGKLMLNQEDFRLIDFIRNTYIIEPPKSGTTDTDWSVWYGTKNKYDQQEISRLILKLLGDKRGGTFVECGANDGEWYSNTMLLEKDYGWSGLLIEADPRPLARLLTRNRNAFISNSCLSTSSTPTTLEFERHDKFEGLSRIVGKLPYNWNGEFKKFTAQCFPFYSIIKSIQLTTIDYFSLDIEGAELDVLKTIPWDKVLIKVLSIEVLPHLAKPVKEFMTKVAGYKFFTFVQNEYSHDQIYIHKEVFKNQI